MLYPVIVIGSGVAGISTHIRLLKLGVRSFLIEAGHPLKKRLEDPNAKINGFGGSGLYSDRKISTFPAGSNLLYQNPYELRNSFCQIIDYLKAALPDHEKQLDELLLHTMTYLGDHTMSSEVLERKLNESRERKHQVENHIYTYHSMVINSFEDAVKILNSFFIVLLIYL